MKIYKLKTMEDLYNIISNLIICYQTTSQIALICLSQNLL